MYDPNQSQQPQQHPLVNEQPAVRDEQCEQPPLGYVIPPSVPCVFPGCGFMSHPGYNVCYTHFTAPPPVITTTPSPTPPVKQPYVSPNPPKTYSHEMRPYGESKRNKNNSGDDCCGACCETCFDICCASICSCCCNTNDNN